MLTKKKRTILLVVIAAVALLAVLIPFLVMKISKAFTAQEQAVRTDWSFDTGNVVDQSAEWNVDITQANLGDGLNALQLVPQDIQSEGFTYYDLGVQQRLHQVIEELKSLNDVTWSASQPLTILNPYGTGSNGLYFYFETEVEAKINYTIHVPDSDVPDYTAQAADISGEEYSKTHEFQMIGLVPGETNEVTMTVTGSWGNTRQVVHFTVEMPEIKSGYATRLEVTQGSSGQEQTDGLFAMMRVNGYLGYGFFFDNDGILRYEMVLEGYGLDRLLFYGNEIITCVSSSKLARINGLGQVTQIYELGDYDLHHDIEFGAEGEVLALAEERGNETVEDRLLSIDLETGQVTERINFSTLMEPYYETTREVGPSDAFFWQAGERDWIHLNSLVYLAEEDSVILSSRETSTIIKVTNLHDGPEIDWLLGDESVWQDTSYSEKCLTQEGDFVPQYGQHCVEYYADGEEDGVYYLSLYNNNYWSTNSRDVTLELEESVSTDLYGSDGITSQVYVYRIDENEGTYSLQSSFDVPYSSIVSNGSLCEDSDHWVVNSGMAMVFGEYDEDGVLIRQYEYECTMQNYRTFKYDMDLWLWNE